MIYGKGERRGGKRGGVMIVKWIVSREVTLILCDLSRVLLYKADRTTVSTRLKRYLALIPLHSFYGLYFVKHSEAFVPPNPKLFVKTTSTSSRFWALSGT